MNDKSLKSINNELTIEGIFAIEDQMCMGHNRNREVAQKECGFVLKCNIYS